MPVMNEANLRVLRPYRAYLPTPEWLRFHTRIAKLNQYLIDLFRWAAKLERARDAVGTLQWWTDNG